MAGAQCNDFLTPSEQTVKTEMRIPVQSKGCSTSQLHSKDGAGFGERRRGQRRQLRKKPAPRLAPRETCREIRDERGLGGSPEALVLDTELGEQRPPAAGRGAAACPGHGASGRGGTRWVAAHARPGRGQPGAGRSSSSPQPTSRDPETAFTGRGDNEVLTEVVLS